jgi:hypothetical protein
MSTTREVLFTFPSKTLVNLINKLVIENGVHPSWSLSAPCAKTWTKDALVDHLNQICNENSVIASILQTEIDAILTVEFQTGEWF